MSGSFTWNDCCNMDVTALTVPGSGDSAELDIVFTSDGSAVMSAVVDQDPPGGFAAAREVRLMFRGNSEIEGALAALEALIPGIRRSPDAQE